MSIMTIEEYCTEYPGDDAAYAKRLAQPYGGTFPPEIIQAGMIHWFDQPQNWAGPFKGNYVFFRLVNHNTRTDLPTADELEAKQIRKEMYSSFNVRYADFLRIFQTKDHTFTILGADGNKYSRSEMSHEELMEVKKELGDKWFDEHMAACIEKCMKQPYTKHMPCKETPYSLYLCGNDDTSYTAFFATQSEAEDVVDKFNDYPSTAFLKSRFVFTN